MFRSLICLLLGFCLLPTSCKGQHTVSANEADDHMMVLVLQDDYSGRVTEELLVLKDQKSLVRFFATINRTRKPGLPVPEVDFAKEMLVVWCAGETQQPAKGLSFVDETSDTYMLSKIKPDPTTRQSAIISPFFIYKIPLSNKKIALQ